MMFMMIHTTARRRRLLIALFASLLAVGTALQISQG